MSKAIRAAWRAFVRELKHQRHLRKVRDQDDPFKEHA